MKKIKLLKLNQDELFPIVNLLNEICNGIYIGNFEKK